MDRQRELSKEAIPISTNNCQYWWVTPVRSHSMWHLPIWRGPERLEVSWDYTSKSYTGINYSFGTANYFFSSTKKNHYTVSHANKRPHGHLTFDFMILLRTVLPLSLPGWIEGKHSVKGGGRDQSNTCLSYSYNHNLTSGLLGPHQIGNCILLHYATILGIKPILSSLFPLGCTMHNYSIRTCRNQKKTFTHTCSVHHLSVFFHYLKW